MMALPIGRGRALTREVLLNSRLSLMHVWFLAMTLTAAVSAATAAPVTQLQVRVVTGPEDLIAGSVLELRIYESGKAVRRFSLTQGEGWPQASTRVIPVALSEPLDARSVMRFALFYKAASPLSPPWQVVSAEVDLISGRGPPERLLNTTLSGVIERQGELATEEREPGSLLCTSDADCDDHRSCNGRERCAPRTVGADARGCVKGLPTVCPVNQVCTEEHGCRGIDAAAPPAAAPAEPVPATTP
jgi:hypothetical protein